MKSSKRSSMQPLPKTANTLSAAIVVVAAIGFVDAAYLAAKFFSGGPIPCSLLNGCETVTTSAYATIAGVPVALLGAVFYFGMLVLAVIFRENGNALWARILLLGGVLGFLFSLWLVAVQVFILDALCLYCLISAGASTLLFVLGILLVRDMRKQQPLFAGEAGAERI